MGPILIVDDDPRIRQMLQRYLTGEGFQVALAGDLRQARQTLARQHISLILLDIKLGYEDGLDFAREVRTGDTVLPIIILSGKGDVVDKVVGLEVGADDYVVKPFHLRELLARIKTVLRRSAMSMQADRTSMDGTAIRFGQWFLLRDSRRLIDRHGGEKELTSSEFKLLDALTRNAQRVLTRDRLMDIVSGRAWTPYDRCVDTQIRRLRKKIEENPSKPNLIKTVRGEGYMLSVKPEPSTDPPIKLP